MVCKHCGRPVGGERPPCPHCQDYTVPAPVAEEPTTVIEPEVIDAQEQSSHQNSHSSGAYYSHQGGQYQYFTWKQATGQTAASFSCLPSIITFTLLLACGAQYGLLAAIGFGFFYILGSIFATAANTRSILQGQGLSINRQWISRILVWGAAWFITATLAKSM